MPAKNKAFNNYFHLLVCMTKVNNGNCFQQKRSKYPLYIYPSILLHIAPNNQIKLAVSW